MTDDLVIADHRIEFLAIYVCKALKLKGERWVKMFNVEDYEVMIVEFFEKNENELLTFTYSGNLSQTSSGASGNIVPSYSYPKNIKTKCIYFKKKQPAKIPIGSVMKELFDYGDISYSPMGQLTAFIDELIVPVLSNQKNQSEWPKVITSDITRHVNNLKNKTYVLTGQIKGKTQLPIPSGAEKVTDQDIKQAEM